MNGPQARGAEARQPALAIGPLGGIVVVWRANALADGTIGPDDDIFFAAPEPGTEWLGPAALLTLLAFRRARMRGSSSRHHRQAFAALQTRVLH